MHATISEFGKDIYNREPLENEVDLVLTVRDMLVNSGISNEAIAAYDGHHFIQSAKGKNSDVQKHYLNRYWHLQLVTVAVNSTDERFCLIPNGTINDWLRLFKAKVLPFIIEHNLPKVLYVG